MAPDRVVDDGVKPATNPDAVWKKGQITITKLPDSQTKKE